MPKEITHWWLAGEVLGTLRSSVPLQGDGGRSMRDGGSAAGPSMAGGDGGWRALVEMLEKNRNLFLLGAVGPDFLFYYLFGPEHRRFLAAAGVLHGSDGSDTLAVLARTARKWGTELPPGVLAFLFGYACHVAADAVFHPPVLYFAGKGTEDARYDHHLFESVLDLYVLKKVRESSVPSVALGTTGRESSGRKSSVPRRLRDLTAGMEMDRGDFLDLLGVVSFGGGDYPRGALAACLRRFEFVQAAFWNPLGRLAARFLAAAFPNLRHFEASFYQKRFHRMIAAFDRPVTYRHPVTGEERQDTIGDLRDRMVAQCVGYAEFFVPGTEDGDNMREPSGTEPGEPGEPGEKLRRLRGPNLETGIPGDKAEIIRYTDPDGVGGFFRRFRP